MLARRIVAAGLVLLLIFAIAVAWFAWGGGARRLATRQGGNEFLTYALACGDEKSCNTPAIFFNGGVEPQAPHGDLAENLNKLLEAHPDVRTICFDSGGGNVQEALKVAKLIESRHLDTCVTQLANNEGQLIYLATACHSSCILMFAAGERRIALQPDIAFLFHRDDAGNLYKWDIENFYKERAHSAKEPRLIGVAELTLSQSNERPILKSVANLMSDYGLVTDVEAHNVKRNAPKCSALATCIRHEGPECSPEKDGTVYVLPPTGLLDKRSC
ncbi:hypothetical protein [Paraburkholderia pallida]|uniref:Uncharacterized protein n=1 Tax=Paraburkholderia pallida TaxID=2547399 RepID=A0A4P7D075_9BURK|nr:hypothetical protein [Paraburkholderia pallida]QBR00080.1 hypothetical protein E1956_23610 [Paraburkholderia pallida]